MMTRIMLWQMVCKPWSLSPHGAPGRLSLVESTPPPQPYIAKPPGDARSPFRASSLLSLGSVSANGCVALAALTMTSSGGLWLGANRVEQIKNKSSVHYSLQSGPWGGEIFGS